MNYIIHPDELFLKGDNKGLFYNRILANLRALFNNAKVKRIENGIWLELNESDKNEDVVWKLSKIPGIANLAEAVMTGNSMKEIEEAVEMVLSKQIFSKENVRFRVTAKRLNKEYPLNSFQIAKRIGEMVQNKHQFKVDLSNFDLNINVNILQKNAIVYYNHQKGAGGLPTGAMGNVLALLSGGIDSPVAAYKMMVRGARVDLAHFHNDTAVEQEVENKIFDLSKKLSCFQPEVKLHMIPYGEIQREIVMKVPADYRMIITRRIFIRIAQDIAKKQGYSALCAGDSLGQVASQTMENLACVYEGSDILKLTPLIGENKRRITQIARKISTLDISQRPYEDCCSMFVAKHPQTKAKLEDVKEIEKNIDSSKFDNYEIKSYTMSMITDKVTI